MLASLDQSYGHHYADERQSHHLSARFPSEENPWFPGPFSPIAYIPVRHIRLRETYPLHPPTGLHFWGTGTKYRPWCTQCNQFVRIHRQIIYGERTGIFNKVSGEPMVLSGRCQVLYLFPKIPAQYFCSACTGGTDKTNRKPGLVSHSNQCGFSITGKSFNSQLFCIYRFIGFKIIDRGLRPRPRHAKPPSRRAYAAVPYSRVRLFPGLVRRHYLPGNWQER